ncbi:ESX-1 secretion-associated protein [Mycobacterium sp. 050134]|uniref:ESX-1 secretion-associated protein n=1 Tax=Mycobacterium sp. 050134 TaxID=3096111 RepID=UPI002ED8BAF6
MADLEVNPSYLLKLATAHDEAVNNIAKGAEAPAGIGVQVWITHGILCGPSAEAVREAEGDREAAFAVVREVSAALAEDLRTAAKAYQGADQNAASGLNHEMR